MTSANAHGRREVSSGPEIRVLQDAEELAREAADLFTGFGNQAQEQRRPFRVCLSGGSTPKRLYETLASPAVSKQVDWKEVEFYFGDERCVPPDHAQSNFALVNAALFRPLGIAADRIFRMRGEAKPEEAAQEYEKLLRDRFGMGSTGWPRFSLLLLGLGEDGHVASLFPDAPELGERRRAVVPTLAPRDPRQRISLTVPVLNEAEAVLFLVAGIGKAEAVRRVLEDTPAGDQHMPASLVRPLKGRLIWLLDRAAASQLRLAKQGIVSHEE
jgi:6-phosphogluconolactonase